MTNLSKISLGIAALALATAGYEWRAASAAEQKTADLQLQLTQQTQLYTTQQASLKEAQESNSVLTLQASSPVAAPARHSLAASPSDPVAKTAAPASDNPPESMIAKMLKDPEMKKAMRSQQEWMVKKQYSSLLKQLNLTPEQSDKFYSIMLAQQEQAMDKGAAMLAGGDPSAAAKDAADTQAATDAQLQALLGDDGMTQYNSFKDALPDRMALDQIKSEFDDHPLSSDQQQKLLDAMHAARQNATPVPGQPDPSNPADWSASMDRYLQSQQDANAQILEQSASFLTPDQLQTLGTAQSNMLSMQKAGMAMAQKMFNGTNGGAIGAPAIAAPQ